MVMSNVCWSLTGNHYFTDLFYIWFYVFFFLFCTTLRSNYSATSQRPASCGLQDDQETSDPCFNRGVNVDIVEECKYFQVHLDNKFNWGEKLHCTLKEGPGP